MSILRVEETQYAQTTGVEGCGVEVWFGKYTDIASLVLLFGFTTPAYSVVYWLGTRVPVPRYRYRLV